MDHAFRESRPILPRTLALTASAVLVSATVFLASEYVLGMGVPLGMVIAVSALFALSMASMFALRMTVVSTQEGLDVTYGFRRLYVPGEEVLDVRKGDLELIRSYDRWNLRGVKHRTYLAVGDESGVAVKLTGKRVLVLSSADPDALSEAIPREGGGLS